MTNYTNRNLNYMVYVRMLPLFPVLDHTKTCLQF